MEPTTIILLQAHWSEFARPDTIFPILIFTIPIVAVVGHYWHAAYKVRQETELKRQMIDAGMSADDIVRVLAAGGPATSCRGRRRGRGDDSLQTSPHA